MILRILCIQYFDQHISVVIVTVISHYTLYAGEWFWHHEAFYNCITLSKIIFYKLKFPTEIKEAFYAMEKFDNIFATNESREEEERKSFIPINLLCVDRKLPNKITLCKSLKFKINCKSIYIYIYTFDSLNLLVSP